MIFALIVFLIMGSDAQKACLTYIGAHPAVLLLVFLMFVLE